MLMQLLIYNSIDSTELARIEEKISKKKAVELFE